MLIFLSLPVTLTQIEQPVIFGVEDNGYSPEHFMGRNLHRVLIYPGLISDGHKVTVNQFLMHLDFYSPTLLFT